MIEDRKLGRRACGILLALCIAVLTQVAGAEEPSPGKAAAEREERPDTSVIRVMHAEIEGRVFLASEDRGIREEPAKDVSVQIREPDNDDVVVETITDEEGAVKKFLPSEQDRFVRDGRLALESRAWFYQFRALAVAGMAALAAFVGLMYPLSTEEGQST